MSLLLAAVTAFELQLPIMCGPAENLLNGLRERFDEEIVFMAPSQNEQGHDLFHSLWINTDTTTWTFVVTNKQKETVCVISSGDNMQMFSSSKTI